VNSAANPLGLILTLVGLKRFSGFIANVAQQCFAKALHIFPVYRRFPSAFDTTSKTEISYFYDFGVCEKDGIKGDIAMQYAVSMQ
jgi:hypothetical protein